jgi:dTDP-4-dehydrorhamnose reductase
MSAAEAVRLDPARGRAVNTEATARLADWCARRDRRIVYTSTDLVFDGSRPWSREEDRAEPVLAYGRTKRDAEPA